MSKCTFSGVVRNSVNAFFNLYFLAFAAELKKNNNISIGFLDFFIICANKPLMGVHLTFFNCIKLELQSFEVTLYCMTIESIYFMSSHLAYTVEKGAMAIFIWVSETVVPRVWKAGSNLRSVRLWRSRLF